MNVFTFSSSIFHCANCEVIMLYQGKNLSLLDLDNHCVELSLNVADSSVNVFSQQVSQEFSAALDVLEENKDH